MPRQPDKYTPKQIQNWDTDCKTPNGNWVPCRPEPRNCVYPWYWRLLCAWNVLTGKADALHWTE